MSRSKNDIIRDLNDVRINQEVRVLNVFREPNGKWRTVPGAVVTVRNVERFGDRIVVSDAIGVIASTRDGSRKLARV